MLVSYNWLQRYFDKKLPDADKLSSLINLHSFEVESVVKLENDVVFDLKITPDRAHYALCHRGVAFEVNAITGLCVKDQTIDPTSVKEGIVTPKIKLGEPDKCSRYMACRIENLSITESPSWLQEFLLAIGARPINSVVDATNFVMFDVGQPLHAFDADKLKGDIIVRSAFNNEKIILLDGTEISLNESDLVIADELSPIAIAGVKGGKRAEVTKETKNIVLEAANFNPVTVRRTANRLSLRNESSRRFENSIVPELAEDAMHRVTKLILEFSKEANVGPVVDVFLKKTDIAPIKTSLSNIENFIGTKLSEYDFGCILNNINVTYDHRGGDYTLYPPLGRLDLKIPEDIADEVIRIKGYDYLPKKLPPSLSDIFLPDKAFYWAEKIKNILVELGFSEVLLYSLSNKGQLEIAHPLAKDKSFLRDSILPKMEDALVLNSNNAELLSNRTVKIFEIGKIFTDTGEKGVVALGVFVKQSKKGINAEKILTADLNVLNERLKINNKYKVTKKDSFATVEFDFDELLSKLPIPGELRDLSFSLIPKDRKYVKFSPYPFIVRDIAIYVPVNVKQESIISLIKEQAVEASLFKSPDGEISSLLVKGPYCFDEFEKDGKKSFAFRMVFQSPVRTLSDEEVNKIMGFVYSAVLEKDWEVR